MNEEIKMFVAGEEVVSQNEFTINEEMLSASSTILNNCYPKSWENDKDYTSRFYYPKDYSKFVLARGNYEDGNEEFSVRNVSGETTMRYETNVEKSWNSFEVYGNVYQRQEEETIGKNKLLLGNIATTHSNVVVSRTNNSQFKLNGISNAEFGLSLSVSTPTLTNGQAYTVSVAVAGVRTKSFVVQVLNHNMTFQPANNTTETVQVYNFTGTGSSATNFLNLLIQNGTEFSNVAIKLQIEEGNSATAFEPYQVIPAMPSPDNPSSIDNVCYQNLFDLSITPSWIGGDTTYNIDGDKLNVYGEWFVGFLVNVNANTDYYINATRNITTSVSSTGNIGIYDASKTFIKTIGLNGGTFNSGNNTQVYILFYSGTGSIGACEFSNIILSKGTIEHVYIPYGVYGLEARVAGKNLFDLNTVVMGDYIGQNATIRASSRQVLYLDPGQYTISTNLNLSTYGVAVAILPNTPPSSSYNAIQDFGYITSQSQTLNVTNAGYAVFTFRKNGNLTFSLNDILSSQYQFEKGSTATTYEPYKSNNQVYCIYEPLRAIGNYKDRLFIQNGYLYVERKIGKIVLRGNEGYNYESGGQRFTTTVSGSRTENTRNPILSNYFRYGPSGNADGIAFNYGGAIYLYNYDYNTTTDFKNWLSTHNTEVQYILETPFTEIIGKINALPISYDGVNNVFFDTGLATRETIYYYWKNYDVLFAGVVKNSGDVSLSPRQPHYCSLQILDYKTFLSESDTLDFVINDKTIKEAIEMVVEAVSNYGFKVGTIDISSANDKIGAYSTLDKTAYDVLQYLANISGSRWRARYLDSSTMVIDFYDPDLLPQANDIEYTKEYWEENNIVDLTFNYGTRDYRNKQVILSSEVYGSIDYTELLLSNGYNTNYITQQNIATVKRISVNGVEKDIITQQEKEDGADADFYYTPGKNVVESDTTYTAGDQITIVYTPLVKGRQIVYNNEEVGRIATQTNTVGIISRYENRNDITSSKELEQIGETYIEYKGKPEVILKLTTQNKDLYNIGEVVYFNAPIIDLQQKYMVKAKETEYVVIKNVINLFYVYELTSSFNSEKAINYFDNQRNKTSGNIAEGESITRNIDINNYANIIWSNSTITEVSVSATGDNILNSVLNSPFIS